jgi:hypothetical protein
MLRSGMAENLADIIHSLVSGELKKMTARMRGSSLRRDEPLVITEFGFKRITVGSADGPAERNGAARRTCPCRKPNTTGERKRIG